MKLSQEKLMAEVADTGFRAEILEKAIRLVDLLDAIRVHPFLKDRIALKGGTALNLFEFDLPRLSVDIDLNYIGSVDVETMKRERPDVEKAITAVCNRAELRIERVATEYAGGKWRLRYDSALGGGANLELDLNFLLRQPLWTCVKRDSKPVGSYSAKQIRILDLHELAAGKIVALMARHAARDLFDCHEVFTRTRLDDPRLRLGFVLYGAGSRKDWRTVSPDNLDFDTEELKQNLIPLLNNRAIEEIGDQNLWAKRTVKECRDGLKRLLPLSENEREFLDRLLDRAQIEPSLLTRDPAMQATISSMPLLRWKAQNVREFKKI